MYGGWNRRGMSAIIATLLIILLTLVAVGIIWVVVRNVIQSGAEQVSLGKFTLNLEIKSVVVDIVNNSLDVKIKRNPGEGKISGLNFIIEDDENTEVVETKISLKELEERTITLVLIPTINMSRIQKVSVAPVFILESGREIIGDIKDTYVISIAKVTSPPPTGCTLDSECNDNDVSTKDVCTSGTCSNVVITLCIDNDGYCPSGCSLIDDNNCVASCGNSIIEGTEQCDCGVDGICTSSELNSATCASVIGIGYTGTLNCTSLSCSFDTSLCVPPTIPLSWKPNLTINASLPSIGWFSTPSVFFKDSSWYLISGGNNGGFYGYAWTGSAWETNLTINASLPNVGSNLAPSVFYKDSSWYMIGGISYGTLIGFVWNSSGNQWIINSTITEGIAYYGDYPTPSVFYKDSSLYMIMGTYDGLFHGFVWDSSGNQWIFNSTITNGLPDVGDAANPSVFQKDGNWYLISGEYDSGFFGFAWDGTQWNIDTTINASLPFIGGGYSAPSVFQKDGNWYLISGEYYGRFYGFVFA